MRRAVLLVGALLFFAPSVFARSQPDSAVVLPLLLPHEPRGCAGAEFLRDLDTLYLTLLTSLNARTMGLHRRVLAARIEEKILQQGVAVEGSYGYDREAFGDGALPLLGPWSGAVNADSTAPMLLVEVNAVPVADKRFVYLVEVDLQVLTVLEREVAAASVWRARDIGVAVGAELVDEVMARVDKLVERFVEERYCINLPRPVK